MRSPGLAPMRGMLAIGIALTCAAAARAQDFNVDVLNNFGTPTSAYGAAATQAGFWMNLDGGLPATAHPMTDINGCATAATVTYTAGFNFFFDNALTLGDDHALMDDLQCLAGGTVWTIAGLTEGDYAVYAYAWAPDSPLLFLTNVTVTGGSAGTQVCGGAAWTGAHVDGVTYVDDGVSVAAGGSITITFGITASFGSVNGLQLVRKNLTSYCTPPAPGTSNGCIPKIDANKPPNITHTSGCMITVTAVEGLKNGIMFYGLAPHAGAWCAGSNLLCVKSPTARTGNQASGGTANMCDGSMVLDWDLYQTTHLGALGQPWLSGVHAYVQGWFRDPPACKTTYLSQALDMTYVP